MWHYEKFGNRESKSTTEFGKKLLIFVPVLHRITAQSIPSSKIYCNTFQNQMPGGYSEVTRDMLRGARTKP